MKQMIKRKLFCSLLLITLLVSGVILFQPRPVLAASKTYEINISKTSASAAEKKLQAWLLKFQNLAANKFGTLPCKYNTTFIDAHPSLKGYYCLKYTGYCSDYVNII